MWLKGWVFDGRCDWRCLPDDWESGRLFDGRAGMKKFLLSLCFSGFEEFCRYGYHQQYQRACVFARMSERKLIGEPGILQSAEFDPFRPVKASQTQGQLSSSDLSSLVPERLQPTSLVATEFSRAEWQLFQTWKASMRTVDIHCTVCGSVVAACDISRSLANKSRVCNPPHQLSTQS